MAGARFSAIELQRVECETKVAHTVVVHRAPGQLELHVEGSIDLDETAIAADPAFAHFEIVHFGWLEGNQLRCDIVGGELDATASFTDVTGAAIEVRARHRSGRNPQPLFTPAPPQRSPRNLRFLVVNQLRLLPTRGSEVSVTVDGVPVTPEPLLLPADRARYAPFLETRSGAEMMLASLLPEHHDRPLELAGLTRTELDDGTAIDVSQTGVRSVRLGNDHGWFTARFTPALPRLDDPTPTIGASGELTIESSLGVVATGRWLLTSNGEGRAQLALDGLSQDWFPGWRQPHRIVLQQVRKQRRRHQQWRYRADLERRGDTWYSTGAWA